MIFTTASRPEKRFSLNGSRSRNLKDCAASSALIYSPPNISSDQCPKAESSSNVTGSGATDSTAVHCANSHRTELGYGGKGRTRKRLVRVLHLAGRGGDVLPRRRHTWALRVSCSEGKGPGACPTIFSDPNPDRGCRHRDGVDPGASESRARCGSRSSLPCNAARRRCTPAR